MRKMVMEGSVSLPGKGISSFAARCMQSWRNCLSTTVIPSLDLLGSLRLTLFLMRLARLPAAIDRRPAVIATLRAMIQYCWFSIWDLVRSPKFISSRNLLPSGISSGGVSQFLNGLFDVLKRFVVEIAA